MPALPLDSEQLVPTVIEEITSSADLVGCEEIQRSVWQADERGLVPAAQFRAVQHAGGLVAGAWSAGELVGFCYGFPAYRPLRRRTLGLHSHMAAVLAEARGLGIGRSLKWFQRKWCLERDLPWVEWTFDPLRARNARLNLEHLGATAEEYLDDAYGEMADGLNAGIPSDRLVACWDLTSREVRRLANGEGRLRETDGATPVLTAGFRGEPLEPRLELSDPELSLPVPPDLGGLLEADRATALAWRLAVREALNHYFARGYRATRFIGGAYRLERVTNGEGHGGGPSPS